MLVSPFNGWIQAFLFLKTVKLISADNQKKNQKACKQSFFYSGCVSAIICKRGKSF